MVQQLKRLQYRRVIKKVEFLPIPINHKLTTMNKLNLFKTASVAIAFAAVAFPSVSFAASYAYVDQAGDVRIVEAANPNTALMTAPNIDEHSGVMLLVNPTDPITGDHVLVQ